MRRAFCQEAPWSGDLQRARWVRYRLSSVGPVSSRWRESGLEIVDISQPLAGSGMLVVCNGEKELPPSALVVCNLRNASPRALMSNVPSVVKKGVNIMKKGSQDDEEKKSKPLES